MKKVLIVCAAVLGLAACAETYHETGYSYNTYAGGCTSCAQPYAVKVGSEVIDHYQAYQPVTTYRPAGTFSTRRTMAQAPATGCGARRTSTCGY